MNGKRRAVTRPAAVQASRVRGPGGYGHEWVPLPAHTMRGRRACSPQLRIQVMFSPGRLCLVYGFSIFNR